MWYNYCIDIVYIWRSIVQNIKSKKRVKDYGEVFTPKFIVDEMIALIPDEVWSDPTKTVLEPACGTGNFVIEIIKKKISCGSTPLQAIETTFAVDICEDNIKETRQKVLTEIYDKINNKEFRQAIYIIHNNIFIVTDTLKVLKILEKMPLYKNKKQKKRVGNWKKTHNFNFFKLDKKQSRQRFLF